MLHVLKGDVNSNNIFTLSSKNDQVATLLGAIEYEGFHIKY